MCAAGLSGSNADDVAKEIAIYRAHKAAPIVIATEGERRFGARSRRSPCPPAHPDSAFVLSAMAGHLFGYEAALAIDASARPAARGAGGDRGGGRRTRLDGADDLLERLAPAIEPPAATVPRRPARRQLRRPPRGGHRGADRVAAALRDRHRSRSTLYQVEHGKVGTPSRVVEDLTAALTAGIEELTRPVDAIKHQAKTVTVGISRSDETLLQVPLVREVLAAGAARDASATARCARWSALDPAVEEVIGFTRYRIEGDVDATTATIHVVDRGGISVDLRSRTDDDPRLRRHEAPRRDRSARSRWPGADATAARS